MQNYLQERHGAVTLLLSADGRNERKGFLVDGHAPLYSIARIPRATMEGRTSVNAYEYFEGKLREIVSNQLGKYMKDHADDMSIYSENGFWADALRYAGIRNDPHIMALYYEIQSGVLHFIIDGRLTNIIYDVIMDECLFRRENEEAERTGSYALLDEFFGPSRCLQMIAESQMSNNLAPHPFSEIAAVNEFLSDKKRDVYAVFRGNANVKLKADNGRYHIGMHIASDRTGFCLRGMPGYSLHELIGIRCRHTVFPINARLFCDSVHYQMTGTGD